jgi:L-asparaginase
MGYDDRVLGGRCDKFRKENGFESFSTEIPQRRADEEK